MFTLYLFSILRRMLFFGLWALLGKGVWEMLRRR